MPRFNVLERQILQASDVKDMFVEKFAQMIERKMAEEQDEDKQDGVSTHKAEHEALPPPLFASRGKIEFVQFSVIGLDPYTHDMLLNLYERQPVRPRA